MKRRRTEAERLERALALLERVTLEACQERLGSEGGRLHLDSGLVVDVSTLELARGQLATACGWRPFDGFRVSVSFLLAADVVRLGRRVLAAASSTPPTRGSTP